MPGLSAGTDSLKKMLMGAGQSWTESSLQEGIAHLSKGGNLPEFGVPTSEGKLTCTGRELVMACPLQVHGPHYWKQSINTCVHLMLPFCTFYMCNVPILSSGTIIF